MSYPCSRCIEDGIEEPFSVKRKKDWCASCRKHHGNSPYEQPPREPPLTKEQLEGASIEDITDGTLRMLYATQTRLEKRMLESTRFNPVDAGEVVKVAKAVGVAIKEIRIIRENEHKKIDEYTNDEMRDIMSEWFKTVAPRAMQHEMLKDLVAHYRANEPKEAQSERKDG